MPEIRDPNTATTEIDDLRRQLAESEQTRRDLSRELSSVKGDLTKTSNAHRAIEDANTKLSQELVEARDQVREANSEAKERRLELRKVEAERDDLFGLYNELEKERDTLSEKITNGPQEAEARVGEYQKKLRTVAHERAFEKVARGLKVNDPTKFSDLLALAKYEADADDPDETKIAERFGEIIKGRSWLVDGEPPTAAPPEASPAKAGVNGVIPSPHMPPAPGADRGTSDQTQQVERSTARIPGRF